MRCQDGASGTLSPSVRPQSQEAAGDHSRDAIELLRAAHSLFARLGPARPVRLLSHIGSLMVRPSPVRFAALPTGDAGVTVGGRLFIRVHA